MPEYTAKLMSMTKTLDADGFNVDVAVEYEIFVEKKSVTRSEFYMAMSAGMKPKIVLSTRIENYEQTRTVVDGVAKYAEKIRYEDAVYDIIRTYEKDSAYIELMCG
jgi:hypothetical protein